MEFSESTKLEAKTRAHFRCVVCQQPWVEVHHIKARADGGENSLENAAPLCAGCHHRFGGNPELRKQLREMRDHWWQRCAASDQSAELVGLSQKLDTMLHDYTVGRTADQALLGDVKQLMAKNISVLQNSVSSATTAPEIVKAVVTFATGAPPEPASGPSQGILALSADEVALLKHIASEGGAVSQHSESHTDAGLSQIRYDEAVHRLLVSRMLSRQSNTMHTRRFPRLSLTSSGRQWAIANGYADRS